MQVLALASVALGIYMGPGIGVYWLAVPVLGVAVPVALAVTFDVLREAEYITSTYVLYMNEHILPLFIIIL